MSDTDEISTEQVLDESMSELHELNAIQDDESEEFRTNLELKEISGSKTQKITLKEKIVSVCKKKVLDITNTTAYGEITQLKTDGDRIFVNISHPKQEE